MTKSKSTKRALLMSALALITCVSMLVGSTFAWFTDSVTSGKNTIQSGNLDIKLEYSIQKDGVWSEYAEVDANTDIFGYNNWEPGYTAIAKFRVTNVGSLALKYQLTADVYEETPGVNVAGQEFLLSDYLYTEVVDANATREQILASTTGKRLKATVNGGVNTDLVVSARALEQKNQSEEVALAIWMPTTVGNEANHNGTKQPAISFGINLLATQYTKEEDSFNDQYDKDAPLLVWDGTVDTSWYDASAATYELSSPAKLAGLAKLVNEGNSFAGKTIKLAADMDLNNIAWTPIGIKIDEDTTNSFNGKFYGNGFTIYNLNVSGTKGVGLIGFAGNAAHIEGVHIVGASVTGENSVGAVLGYGYLAKDCLKYCTVEDATIYATAGAGKEDGDKVGAVAGWTSNGNIIGNKAVNCEIYGCRDIGGVVGYVNGENWAVEVSGNTVENVTVSVIKTDYKEPNKLGSNINAAVGRTGSNVTVKSNSGKIAKEENAVVAATSTELKEAAAAGGEVVVVAGNFTFPGNSIAKDTTLICAPGTEFEGKTSLNINGATVVGATFTSDNQYLVNQSTVNGTFKDCVFTDSDGLRSCYAGETVVFENCVFDTDFYGVHFDSGKNDVVFKNCTFSGFNTFGSALTKLTLEDCTFKYNGKGGYNGINLWGDTEMTNCTFVFDGSASNEWVDLRHDNKTVTFTNCVVTDGKTEKGMETVVGNYGTGNTIMINGERVYIASENEILSDAVANGATKVLLTDDEYDLKGIQKDGLTLIGVGDNVKVANTTKYANNKAVGAIWQATNLENVTITNTVYTMADGGKSTFTNVNFAAGFRQGYGTGVVFTDCTFGSNSEGYALHFQTDSASEGGLIKLNGCEFEGGKVHLGGKRAYEFTNCDFTTGTDFQVWSNITLDGCTVDGAEVTVENVATLFPNLNLEKVTIQ